VDAGLTQQLEARRLDLKQRTLLLDAVRDGAFKPGLGHSDRLQLLAKTIPAKVWIKSVDADAQHLEITGFTLEPAALNEWVARLSPSPLLQGLQLSAMQVDNTALASSQGVVPGQANPNDRAVWSFRLKSERPEPPSTPAGAQP
jgi:Tfp pilus assembly protein PilN